MCVWVCACARAMDLQAVDTLVCEWGCNTVLGALSAILRLSPQDAPLDDVGAIWLATAAIGASLESQEHDGVLNSNTAAITKMVWHRVSQPQPAVDAQVTAALLELVVKAAPAIVYRADDTDDDGESSNDSDESLAIVEWLFATISSSPSASGLNSKVASAIRAVAHAGLADRETQRGAGNWRRAVVSCGAKLAAQSRQNLRGDVDMSIAGSVMLVVSQVR